MYTEFSLESAYSAGLGIDTTDKSIETFVTDGDLDSATLDMCSAENMLNFTDTYSKLEKKNASDMMNMLKKLSIHYGRGSSKAIASIESFINVQSLEADAAEQTADGPSSSIGEKMKNGVIDTNTINNKAVKFLATVFNGICKVIYKVFDWIRTAIGKFINWIKSLFDKRSDNGKLAEISELPTEEERLLNSALEKTVLETQSKDGEMSLVGDPIKGLAKTTNDIYKPIVERLKNMSSIISQENKVHGKITDSFNAITEYMSKITNAGAAPKISNIDKESMKTYKEALSKFADSIDYNKNPAGFVNSLCGGKLITSDKIKIADIMGTSNVKDLLAKLNSMKPDIEALKKSIDEANSIFKIAESTFNTVLQKYQKPVENADEDMKLQYETINNANICFKLVAKYSTLIQKVQAKILNSNKTAITKTLEIYHTEIVQKSKDKNVKNKELDKDINDFNKNAKDLGADDQHIAENAKKLRQENDIDKKAANAEAKAEKRARSKEIKQSTKNYKPKTNSEMKTTESFDPSTSVENFYML